MPRWRFIPRLRLILRSRLIPGSRFIPLVTFNPPFTCNPRSNPHFTSLRVPEWGWWVSGRTPRTPATSCGSWRHPWRWSRRRCRDSWPTRGSKGRGGRARSPPSRSRTRYQGSWDKERKEPIRTRFSEARPSSHRMLCILYLNLKAIK